MRWKILLAASLLAALAGAGLAIATAWVSNLYRISAATPIYLTVAVLVFPVAAITIASIFVYRHTSRRRPLQAILTALLASLLTLATLAVLVYVVRRTHYTVPFLSAEKFNG